MSTDNGTSTTDYGNPFGELLDLLNIGAVERVSICSQKPGDKRFEAAVPVTLADAVGLATSTPYSERCVWFGVNPVDVPNGYYGRGTAAHVTRCAALYADLDLKAGGIIDSAIAEKITLALAEAMGTAPVAVVSSGHGWHVYFALDRDDDAWRLDTDAKRAAARAIYRRFGRLCADIADSYGCKVDTVSELARVLRVPGSYNHKDPDAPILVELHTDHPFGGGGVLSYSEVADRLTEHSVSEMPEDRETLGAAVTEPAGWQFGDETTRYVTKMITGWPTDTPKGGRHGWLVGQATRLACAHRLSRITEADHRIGAETLSAAFLALLTGHGEPRRPTPGEVAGALAWGVRRASAFTDDRAAEEVGGTDDYPALAPALDDDLDPNGVGQTIRHGDGQDDDGSVAVTVPGQAKFTDAGLAQTIATKVLGGKFLKARGIGWLHWTGTYWRESGDGPPTEAVRRYVLGRIRFYASRVKANPGDLSAVESIGAWKSAASRHKITAVLALAGNIVEIEADRLDADKDLLNTPSGIVDLRTGEVGPHDQARLMTKITKGAYRVNDDGSPYTHPDWDAACEALPEVERAWLQRRIGQAITGFKTTDGAMVLLQGSGENGKSLLTTDGLVPALGDYGHTASAKLFSGEKGSEHSTEQADLRGRRLVIGEELTEGRSLNITAIKRVTDVGRITARKVFQDNSSFEASHSLLICTNHRPLITETDHGTWRRLLLLVFPYRFQKRGEDVVRDTDRLGDPLLKNRVMAGADGQHDALVTWAVQGAIAWYADPATALLPTERVEADTRAWRADTDRVLGFWTERLAPDRDGAILTTDMIAEFNGWLTGNGHREWSLETFGPRFAEHQESQRHGVEQRRVRNPKGLSRPNAAANNLTGQARVWLGVRFRRAEDEMRAYVARTDPYAADMD